MKSCPIKYQKNNFFSQGSYSLWKCNLKYPNISFKFSWAQISAWAIKTSEVWREKLKKSMMTTSTMRTMMTAWEDVASTAPCPALSTQTVATLSTTDADHQQDCLDECSAKTIEVSKRKDKKQGNRSLKGYHCPPPSGPKIRSRQGGMPPPFLEICFH